MPTFGGFSPYPRRFGGGRTRVQDCLDALNADRGTAFDAEDTESVVYAENMALARAISAAWGTNVRLGYLWDPMRCPLDVLARWERIMALYPRPEDNEVTRRRRVLAIFEAIGKATVNGLVHSLLEPALGEALVAVEHISVDNAVITVPDDSYPWGSVSGSSPWSSTVSHILIRLQKPAGWTEAQFYEAAGKVSQLLDPALPVWVTFDWYRAGETSVAVEGGASAAGFYLDDDANLDNQVLDE